MGDAAGHPRMLSDTTRKTWMAGTGPAMTGSCREGQVRLGGAVIAASRLLREAGVETPELDARLLLCHATGMSHEAYVAKSDAVLGEKKMQTFDSYVARRLNGEPVSRIVGVREFYGRDFSIDPHVLDPRADTETLIEAALAFASTREAPLDLLDLGTGSGAILVTLLAELPHARGLGTDISEKALAVARANVEAMGVTDRARFMVCDWFEGVEGRFDLVVSNPPYIASGAIEALTPEVREHDPILALDGGKDGLDAYRRIAAAARAMLRPGGVLLLEIGEGQAEAVLAILRDAGLVADVTSLRRDLAGRPRVVMGCAR